MLQLSRAKPGNPASRYIMVLGNHIGKSGWLVGGDCRVLRLRQCWNSVHNPDSAVEKRKHYKLKSAIYLSVSQVFSVSLQKWCMISRSHGNVTKPHGI